MEEEKLQPDKQVVQVLQVVQSHGWTMGVHVLVGLHLSDGCSETVDGWLLWRMMQCDQGD